MTVGNISNHGDSDSPSQPVLQVGRTVMVTRTGLLSFPPQSTATTERTWLRESLKYREISVM